MRNVIVYCLIVVCGILGLGSGLVFGQGTPTVTVTSPVSTPQPPTATTEEVWGSTVSGRATLRGAVNPNGLPTTVWFEYGTSNGSYSNISPTQSVTGTVTTRVSIDISGISESFEVYYYRIAAQNSAGTSYGDEKEFYAGLNDDNCYIYGYVKDTTTKNSLENAAVTLAFVKGGESSRDALTDASGYYEFVEFLCEDVICTASANGYNPLSQTLPLSFYGEYIYALDFELQPISTSTTPTPAVTPTPTPIVTSIPECEFGSIEVLPKKLVLKRGQIGEVITTVEGDNCVPEGAIVRAKIGKFGNRRISVLPESQATDENGQAKFTITAKNRIGSTRVTFKVDNLRKSIIVKVRK
ncbi:MAG TPA: hypothetical protein DCE80_08590 [Ignavibacteriales bacterium]|nr:MAG: hypothetical protein A3G70_00515 [Planctomycetes bacterium RIFCSPLOWO2_12_FULL_39_13]HAB52209.1 hypothetical protein [Ignavibacteriales bacterium]